MIIEPQVLHQLLNVSQGDVPMALLPDPTTAASERSSVKNRLTGSQKTRVRHKQAQVQNSQQNEFKRPAQGAGASRGGAGPEPLQPAVKHEKLDRRSGAVCQA